MEEHEKLEMDALKSKLEAILKVQKEENDQAKFHTNSNTANRSYAKAQGSGGGVWSHYLALKLSSLGPSLVTSLEKVQDDFLKELGAGCVSKVCDADDLNLQLLFVKEEIPSSIDLALATLKSLPIISSNQIEFGGILPGKKFVQIGIFSESLESFIIHLNNHLNKCNGTKSMRAGAGGSALSQPGLFTLDVMEITDGAAYKKPSQRIKLGKYNWAKLQLVEFKTDRVCANIDIHVESDKK